MVAIDAILSVERGIYVLNTKRKNTNAYESIDQYSRTYAENSTPETENIDCSGLDSSEIIESLKLYDPESRLAILNMFRSGDLVNLLFLLNKQDLLMGLKFFTKDKLLKFAYNLPKETLLNVLNQIFSKDEILDYLPIKDLMHFLDTAKIPMDEMIKVFQTLPTHILAQIAEAATGVSQGNKSNKELLEELSKINQGFLMEGTQSLKYKEMLSIIKNLTTQNANHMQEFHQAALLTPLEKCDKTTIIESMGVLDPESLIKYLKQLPDNLIAQVITLLPPEQFAEILISKYPDILKTIFAA